MYDNDKTSIEIHCKDTNRYHGLSRVNLDF